MDKNVVYLHVKKGTNDVFYVGIGKNKRRAYSTKGRNDYWNKVVSKYGYEVRVVNTDLTRESACAIEKELIAAFGKNKVGQLTNMTDGGEGFNGKHTPETKQKISDAQKGRDMSKAWKISADRRRGNPRPFETWEKLETRRKMSAAKKDKKQSKEHIEARFKNWEPVNKVEVEDGKGNSYESIAEAARQNKCSVKTIQSRLRRGSFGWKYKK